MDPQLHPHDWSCGVRGDNECCICHAWSSGHKNLPAASIPCPGKNPGDTHTYDFISDPGHGWIRIPYAHLLWLDLQDDITGYSYLHESDAYLEEDQDGNTFMEAAKKAHWKVTFNEIYDEKGTIRTYPPFRVIKL